MAETIIKKQKESPSSMLINILFNIVIPVMVLKKLSVGGENAPLIALLVAISFPVVYFIYEYIKLGKRNWISVLGFFNILLTGGFALMQLEGIWFAVKEAGMPLLIGIFVLLSPKISKASLIESLILNPSFFKIDMLKEKLKMNSKEKEFKRHLRKTNVFLAYSFFLSAILNFLLAIYIFTDIPVNLTANEHSTMLNSQISDMTWMSWLVIAIPSMICLGFIMQYLSKGIKDFTGLSLFDLMDQPE